MSKIIVVAIREYLAAVRSKAFIITIVLAPVMMASGFIAEAFLGDASLDISDRRIAVIDRTGQLYDKLAAAAELRNAVEIFDTPEDGGPPSQTAPRFVLERIEPGETPEEELLLQLSERVREGSLFAFVDIGANVMNAESPEDPLAAVNYYSNAPTYAQTRVWLNNRIALNVQGWRFAQSGIDSEKVGWVMQPTPFEHRSLVERDAATGEIIQGEKIDRIVSTLVPVLLVVLLFMVIMMGAGPLIQSVLEEKMQRIAEVLLGSIDPFKWMMGKLLGVVGVSLTIVIVYLAGGAVVAHHRGILEMIPLHLIGWFAAYQTLAVLMYGAVFVGVGAACSDHREAQTALTPMMILIMVPMFLLENVLREPNSGIATVLSMVPPLTPVLMMIRQAVPPGIPAWQPAVGMLLVMLTTVLCVFAAGRVFRVGILMQGKGASVRDMMRWIIKG